MKYSIHEMLDREMTLLRFAGALDFEARREFQVALNKLQESVQTKLVIDLTHVQTMSSLYLGTLLDFAVKLRQDGKTLTIHMCEKAVSIARHTGLDKVAVIVEVL